MILTRSDSLNPLQKAYLLARENILPLSGLAMHDFREYRGNIDAETLQKNLERLVDKYDVLRTTIDAEKLQSNVWQSGDSQFEVIDLSDSSPIEAQHTYEQLRARYSHYQHLLKQPLWKFWLFNLPTNAKEDNESDKETIIFTSFDGLTFDGYAINQIILDAFSENKDAIKEHPSKHTLQQNNNKASILYDNKDVDKQYWQQKLAPITTVMQLPWEKELDSIYRSDSGCAQYSRKTISIDGQDYKDLIAIAAKDKLLPNSLLTTLILMALSHYTATNEIIVSLPISNSAMINTLGTHSSFIVLESRYNPQEQISVYAKSVQQDILAAMQHASFSGIELGKLLVKQTGKIISLPVAITNGLSWREPTLETHGVRYHSGLTQTPQLALDIRLSLSADNRLVMDLDYATDALSTSFIEQFAATLETIFLNAAAVDRLSKALVDSFMTANSLTSDNSPPASKTDHETDTVAIEDYLGKISSNLWTTIPHKAAIIFGDTAIYYETLGNEVAKVIQALEKNNIKRGQVLAICLDRSPEFIYSLLACALQGVIWVPIDIQAPTKRIQYFLDNSNVDAIIGSSKALEGDWDIADNIKWLDIDNILSATATAVNLTLNHQYTIDTTPAYYLYTSGSTGTPKCVVLNHLATANVVEQSVKTWRLNQSDVVMAVTPFHHDMSNFDIFGGLSVGATLVLPTPTQAKSAIDWANLVDIHHITFWSSVPAIVDMLLTCATASQLQSIRHITLGGDYIKPYVIQELRELIPHAQFYSIGGPTETTIWNIWHNIQKEDIEVIPYGKAMANNEHYIVDDDLQVCPYNVVGTICMTGGNLSNGYLKNKKLDQSDFVNITDSEGQTKLGFLTSDLGYLREDGNIIFSGRHAGYLKVRGVRIASLDVEQSIAKLENITSAIVLCTHNAKLDTDELVAVYQTKDHQAISAKKFRECLNNELPSSHIPSKWLHVESIPLTANGKADRTLIKNLAQSSLYDNEAATKSLTPSVVTKAATTNQSNHTKPDTTLTAVTRYISECFASVVPKSQDYLTVDLQTLGIRPKQLAAIKEKINAHFQIYIDVYALIACSTIQSLIHLVQQRIAPQ